MSSSPQKFYRQPLSFVRRGDRLTGRRLKAWQEYAQDYVLDIPRKDTDTSVAPGSSFDAASVFGRQAPLTLEIGSGLGDAIVARAAEEPETNFLAVEVYTPGIADLLRKMASAQISNIRIAQANAPEFLDNMLPAQTVDQLWVFFPDPWHKTRHHKRRLISAEFASKAARVLKPGAHWYLATDWQEYALHMREVLDAHPDFNNLYPANPADLTDPEQGWAPRWQGRIVTSFEAKASRAGRTARDLAYQRQ